MTGAASKICFTRCGRGDRTLPLGDHHPDGPKRIDQHHHVEVELGQLAHGQVVVEHLHSAVPEDDGEAHHGKDVEQGHEERPDARQIDDAVVDAAGLARQLSVLDRFGAEALDGSNAGHRLLHDRGEPGQLLLQCHGHGMNAVGEPSGAEVDDRQ